MVKIHMTLAPRPVISLIAGCALFFSLAAGVAGRAGADDYERGFRALEDGRFDEALYYISLYAANGDPRAQYTMGVMHRGVPGWSRTIAKPCCGFSRQRSRAICSGNMRRVWRLIRAAASTVISITPCTTCGKRR